MISFAFSIVKAFNRGCKPFLHFFVKKIFGVAWLCLETRTGFGRTRPEEGLPSRVRVRPVGASHSDDADPQG